MNLGLCSPIEIVDQIISKINPVPPAYPPPRHLLLSPPAPQRLPMLPLHRNIHAQVPTKLTVVEKKQSNEERSSFSEKVWNTIVGLRRTVLDALDPPLSPTTNPKEPSVNDPTINLPQISVNPSQIQTVDRLEKVTQPPLLPPFGESIDSYHTENKRQNIQPSSSPVPLGIVKYIIDQAQRRMFDDSNEEEFINTSNTIDDESVTDINDQIKKSLKEPFLSFKPSLRDPMRDAGIPNGNIKLFAEEKNTGLVIPSDSTPIDQGLVPEESLVNIDMLDKMLHYPEFHLETELDESNENFNLVSSNNEIVTDNPILNDKDFSSSEHLKKVEKKSDKPEDIQGLENIKLDGGILVSTNDALINDIEIAHLKSEDK